MSCLGPVCQNVPCRKWHVSGSDVTLQPRSPEGLVPARPCFAESLERHLTCTAQQVPAAQGPVLSGSQKVLGASQPPEAEVPEDHRSRQPAPGTAHTHTQCMRNADIY